MIFHKIQGPYIKEIQIQISSNHWPTKQLLVAYFLIMKSSDWYNDSNEDMYFLYCLNAPQYSLLQMFPPYSIYSMFLVELMQKRGQLIIHVMLLKTLIRLFYQHLVQAKKTFHSWTMWVCIKISYQKCTCTLKAD